MAVANNNTNSTNELNEGVDNISILRLKTRELLSILLNPPKVLRTDDGLPRDWQGLAELCEISGEKIPSLYSDVNPTARILDLWLEKCGKAATIDKLINYLEQMDRFDIIDDLQPLIEQDKELYISNCDKVKTLAPNSMNKLVLTRHDMVNVERNKADLEIYDAFVLFADSDIEFAATLIETMENQYKLKLCVKDRDLVAGAFEHESVITIIAERCNRLIVIVSQEFFESPMNQYFYRFAQADGITKAQRKIIPCIYKDCPNLPPELAYYSKLDFRKTKLYNFWDRLYHSVKPVNNILVRTISPTVDIYNANSNSENVTKENTLSKPEASSIQVRTNFNTPVVVKENENSNISHEQSSFQEESPHLSIKSDHTNKPGSMLDRFRRLVTPTKSPRNTANIDLKVTEQNESKSSDNENKSKVKKPFKIKLKKKKKEMLPAT